MIATVVMPWGIKKMIRKFANLLLHLRHSIKYRDEISKIGGWNGLRLGNYSSSGFLTHISTFFIHLSFKMKRTNLLEFGVLKRNKHPRNVWNVGLEQECSVAKPVALWSKYSSEQTNISIWNGEVENITCEIYVIFWNHFKGSFP